MIFKDWGIDDIFQYASELGYDGLEISPFTLGESVFDISPNERERIRQLAEKTKVAVVGIQWLLASPAGLYINHYDPKVRERTKNYLLELVRFCADIGGSIMVFGSPKQRQILEQVTFADAWNYTKATFKECAEFAQTQGVTICIEPLSTEFPNNFIRTPAEAVKMIEEINHPNFKLIIDTLSCAGEIIDTPRALRKYKKYIAHVHVNDDNKSYPGRGGIVWPPIAEALKEINYQGYISTEIFIWESDPKTIAGESIEFLRRLFQ